MTTNKKRAAKNEIAIVGAGLVGSLLSIFLAKKGHSVSIYEARPDMRKAKIGGGRSINLALSDRGIRALKQVGIYEEIKKLCIKMPGRMIHPLGDETIFQPYGREGQYINSVSRAELNKLLMNHAEKEGVKIYFNKKCKKINQDTNTIKFQEKDKNFEVTPDVIFGADGAYSAVRSSMQKTDRFNYSQSYLEHGYKELSIPPAEGGGWRIEKNALHIWPRKSFMLIALPNIDGSFTCTLFLAFENKENNEPSFADLKTEEDMQHFFREYFPDVLPHMSTLTEDFFNNPTSSLVTIKCYPWAHNGNIGLIGDAAHALVPFYGQGMNAGFEDCSVLHDIMEEEKDWTTIFSRFQQERKDDADAIADLALKNFIEMRDKVANPEFLRRKELERKLQEKFPDKFLPEYGMVTFSKMPYSEAQRRGKEQEEILRQLLKIENVENRLEEPEIEGNILRLLNKEL